MNPKARNCAERKEDEETWRLGDWIWNPWSPCLLSVAALPVCSKPAGPLLVVAFEAALLLVEFFAASGVPHQPEAASAVDLQAGPGLEEDWETGSGGDWETGRLGDWETMRR